MFCTLSHSAFINKPTFPPQPSVITFLQYFFTFLAESPVTIQFLISLSSRWSCEDSVFSFKDTLQATAGHFTSSEVSESSMSVIAFHSEQKHMITGPMWDRCQIKILRSQTSFIGNEFLAFSYWCPWILWNSTTRFLKMSEFSHIKNWDSEVQVQKFTFQMWSLILISKKKLSINVSTLFYFLHFLSVLLFSSFYLAQLLGINVLL